MAFSYQNKQLFWQGDNLQQVYQQASEELTTDYDYTGPFYLYHAGVLQERLKRLESTFEKGFFYYSAKSLSNINILKQIRKFDRFGLDVVSGGEIMRGLLAGFSGKDMVFAGVGKTQNEIILGLQKDIRSFHVESVSELRKIASLAVSLGKTARVALRVNPDIKVDTHKYITTGTEENKFGIPQREIDEALDIIQNSNSLELIGLQCHLGSQLLDPAPYISALEFMLKLAPEAEAKSGNRLQYFSLGGGFGVNYAEYDQVNGEGEFDLQALKESLAAYSDLPYEINFEPGRFLSAYSGILVSKVLYLKNKKEHQIAICDAGISEFIRPALYDSEHVILPLVQHEPDQLTYDIVGPICESTDFLRLKAQTYRLHEGDALAVLHAGAYGAVMSSNYNSRPLVPELMLENGRLSVIRRPQKMSELLSLETEI